MVDHFYDDRSMQLLWEGRASKIFEVGDGKVLRRFKGDGDPHREAAFMRAALGGGVSCPRIFEVLPDELVLERIDGATMHEVLNRDGSPRALASAASELAALHDRVHAITRDGCALVHNDLHWKNIVEADTGPVLLDWSNAEWGDPAVDVALTWVILMTSSGPVGRHLAEQFAQIADTQMRRREAAYKRLGDGNLTAGERGAVRAMLR